jgi:hypothetical protein
MCLSGPALHRQITGRLKHAGFVSTVGQSGRQRRPLAGQVPEGARTERLLGPCESAVRPPWRSRGIGTRPGLTLLAIGISFWLFALAYSYCT